MIRAAMLDTNLYEEVEADPSLDQEAMWVVVLIALLGGVASFLVGLLSGHFRILTLIWSVAGALIGYFLFSYLAYLIGVNLFQGTADYGELRRTLGYAYTPMILGVIPCVGGLIGLVWLFATGTVATRQALDVDTTQAVITVIISAVLMFVILGAVGAVLGIGAAGLGGLMRG